MTLLAGAVMLTLRLNVLKWISASVVLWAGKEFESGRGNVSGSVLSGVWVGNVGRCSTGFLLSRLCSMIDLTLLWRVEQIFGWRLMTDRSLSLVPGYVDR